MRSPAQPETGQAAAALGAPPATASQKPFGYLAASQLPDLIHLLGPPPPPGSGAATGDVATFKATRLRQGDARWTLATSDAVYASAAVLQDFSCALGVELTPATAPLVRHVIDRLGVDAGAAVSVVKRNYHRPRPFVDNGRPDLRAGRRGAAAQLLLPLRSLHLRLDRGPDAGPARAGPRSSGAGPRQGVRREAASSAASTTRATWWLAGSPPTPCSPPCKPTRRFAATSPPLARNWTACAPNRPPRPSGQCRIEADAEAQPIW